ncbi:MAG TPA: shikimate kinase [Lutibacter sp.]|nr:shikimate kinase [Lutibacter sp.]
MKKQNKIVLLGYMGSGKTTLGKELAAVLNHKFIDLDEYIVKKEKLSIAELFETKGEDFFRKKEVKYLKKLLKSKKSFVLALGGGTPQIDGAMKMINKYGLSIYLKASVQTLYNRLAPNEVERPILTQITEDYLFDYIKTHLKKREFNYNRADFSVEVDGIDTKEIIQQIVSKISKKEK